MQALHSGQLYRSLAVKLGLIQRRLAMHLTAGLKGPLRGPRARAAAVPTVRALHGQLPKVPLGAASTKKK